MFAIKLVFNYIRSHLGAETLPIGAVFLLFIHTVSTCAGVVLLDIIFRC